MNRFKKLACAACLLFAGMAGIGAVASEPSTEEPTSPQPKVDCYWDGNRWVC